MPQTNRYPKGHSTVSWFEYKERIPLRLNDVNRQNLQMILDSIPQDADSHAKEKATADLPNDETHISQNPKTFGRELASISTLPDYIPVRAPPILWIAYFYSYGLGGDIHLDRNSTRASEIMSSELQIQQRQKNFFHTLRTKMGTFFRCSGIKPRNMHDKDWQWPGGTRANTKKGDSRYKSIDWNCVTEDQDFRNAVALTIKQRGRGLKHWYKASHTDEHSVDHTNVTNIIKRSNLDFNAQEDNLEEDSFEKFDEEPLEDVDEESFNFNHERDRTKEPLGVDTHNGDESHASLSEHSDNSDIDVSDTDVVVTLTEWERLEILTDHRLWYQRVIMKGGIPYLARHIIKRETEVRPFNPLHALDPQLARRVVAEILFTIHPAILRSLVLGTLSLDKVRSNDVRHALNELVASRIVRPAIYIQSLVTLTGENPSPKQLRRVISLMHLYLAFRLTKEQALLVFEIDNVNSVIQRVQWTASDLQKKRYRLYFNLMTDAQASDPSIEVSIRLKVLADFCSKLQLRLDTSYPIDVNDDAPLEVGICRVGCTTDSGHRFAQHNSSIGSSWLLQLFKAALAVAYPHQFQLDQSVIFLPHARSHISLSECIFSRLSEAYTATATGFSMQPAGTDHSLATSVGSRWWQVWKDEAEEARKANVEVDWSTMFP